MTESVFAVRVDFFNRFTTAKLNQIRKIEVAAIAIESAARGRFDEVQVPFHFA